MKSESVEESQASGMPDLSKMNAERSAKLERFKQNKLLETDIKELKMVINGNSTYDEDVLRNYYLKMKFMRIPISKTAAR